MIYVLCVGPMALRPRIPLLVSIRNLKIAGPCTIGSSYHTSNTGSVAKEKDSIPLYTLWRILHYCKVYCIGLLITYYFHRVVVSLKMFI